MMGNFQDNLAKKEKLDQLSGWMLQEDAVTPFELLLDDGLTPERYIECRFNHLPS